MESINQLANDGLVRELIEFYANSTFTKETVLEKIVEGILTSISKLTDRTAM
jgi:hypothetical protein